MGVMLRLIRRVLPTALRKPRADFLLLTFLRRRIFAPVKVEGDRVIPLMIEQFSTRCNCSR